MALPPSPLSRSPSSACAAGTADTAAAGACVQFRAEQLQLGAATPLGSGAISQVVRTSLRCAAAPSLPVVVKVVSKVQVLQQGKVQCVMGEKAALQRLAPFPYVARLYGTAQSEDELYFVLEWLPHGDLLQHIRRVARDRVRQYNDDTQANSPGSPAAAAIPSHSTALRCLNFHDTRLIAAQLVLALAHTASRGIVLRDLKPENVAFDEKHRVCLLDFDTADLQGSAATAPPESNGGVACPPPVDAAAPADGDRGGGGGGGGGGAAPAAATSATQRRRLTVSEIQQMRRRTASFCGTAQYVSPEMVGECKWSFSSDLWALGALVYELVYGVHLFSGLTQFEVIQKVVEGRYVERAELFPFIDFGADDAGRRDTRFTAVQSFIRMLLHTDPQKRLGVHPDTHSFDAAALRQHPLFHGFDWAPLEAQLQTFRMRRFDAAGGVPVEANSSSNGGGGSGSGSGDGGSGSGSGDDALESLTAACVDPSVSLAALYSARPFNDDAYAEYVYRATADANPFEAFFSRADADAAPVAEGAAVPAAPRKRASAAAASASPAACANCGAADVDEIDDVVDDVGMRYTGRSADKDFQA